MAEGAEVIERDTGVGREPVTLADLTEELRLADAVDTEIPFEIGVELDNFLRIARLIDDETDEESLQLRRRCRSGRRGFGDSRGRQPVDPGGHRSSRHGHWLHAHRLHRSRRSRDTGRLAMRDCLGFREVLNRGSRRRGLLGEAGRGRRADGPPASPVSRPPPGGGIERQHGGRPRSRLAHDNRIGRSRDERPDGLELIADLGEMTGHVATALIKLDEIRPLAALEDASRQTGEHARRPDLDERPHPLGPQLFDHVDPAHRLCHLANKAVTNVVDRGHRRRRRAAVDAA